MKGVSLMYKTQNKRYKIVNKKRFFFLLSFLVFVVFSLLLGFKVNAKDTYNMHMEAVYVDTGDTLWSISKRFVSQDMDIRQYIDNVIKLNNLKSVIIKPGQLLYMPIFNN